MDVDQQSPPKIELNQFVEVIVRGRTKVGIFDGYIENREGNLKIAIWEKKRTNSVFRKRSEVTKVDEIYCKFCDETFFFNEIRNIIDFADKHTYEKHQKL